MNKNHTEELICTAKDINVASLREVGFTPLEKSRSKRLRPRLPACMRASSRRQVERSLTGFTLIETLVAISILLVAITGPLTIATRGLSAALVARDQMTAFYLAQEAIEFVRVKRDEAVLTGSNWIGAFPACMGANTCTVDIPNNIIETCVGTCSPLLYNETSGFFNYLNGAESRFTRSVTLRIGTNSDELEIAVDMQWRTGPANRNFTLRDNLFNWQQ